MRLVSRWPLIEIASAPASQSPLTSFCRSVSRTSAAVTAGRGSRRRRRPARPGPRDRDGAGRSAERVSRALDRASGSAVAEQPVCERSTLAAAATARGLQRRQRVLAARSTCVDQRRAARLASSARCARSARRRWPTSTPNSASATSAGEPPVRPAGLVGLLRGAGGRRARRRARSPRRARGVSGSRAAPSTACGGAVGCRALLGRCPGAMAQPPSRAGARGRGRRAACGPARRRAGRPTSRARSPRSRTPSRRPWRASRDRAVAVAEEQQREGVEQVGGRGLAEEVHRAARCSRGCAGTAPGPTGRRHAAGRMTASHHGMMSRSARPITAARM